eukprot:1315621-Rhodomonas_salina.1
MRDGMRDCVCRVLMGRRREVGRYRVASGLIAQPGLLLQSLRRGQPDTSFFWLGTISLWVLGP